MKPSALLNFIRKADEGFNQVITHFEQGTPIEAAAIDIMEVYCEFKWYSKALNYIWRPIN